LTVQLTPEQRAELERQRQANPKGRVRIDLTPEQRAEYAQAVAEEEASIAANRERFQKRQQAAQEPGFSGDLRRAINAARRPSLELAAQLGIDVQLLEDFRCGDGTLPTDVVGRLVDVLHLRLMAEIHG
jgi:hypothetical protein